MISSTSTRVHDALAIKHRYVLTVTFNAPDKIRAIFSLGDVKKNMIKVEKEGEEVS